MGTREHARERGSGTISVITPVTVLLVGALVAGAWLVSQWNYLLFHTSVELVSIVTATVIFLTAWAARRIATNGFLVVLGSGMLAVAGVILVHSLAYKGMNVLVPPLVAGDSNPTTQLWIASRYILAATILVAPFYLGRKADLAIGVTAACGAAAVLVASILVWKVFPTSFVAGSGLTPFKVISEYVVVATLGIAGAVLWARRGRTDGGVVALTLGSIGAFIAAELFFTLYKDVTGVLNVLGHLAQLVAFILLLLGIFRTVVARPMALAFSELSASEARLARANRALAVLADARHAIADATTEGELLAAVCEVTAKTGDYRLVWIGEAAQDPERSVVVRAACGPAIGYVEGLAVTWSDDASGHGPTGTAIRTGEPWVCRDTEADERFAPWRAKSRTFDLRSSAALPILLGREVWGALNLYSGEPGRFDAEETALMLQVSAAIGTGLAALRLRARQVSDLESLRRQREALEDTVRERTLELEAAVRDLEHASSAKDEFLRSMSHELRTPLNSIIGFSGVLLRGLAGPLSPEQSTQLTMINASGQHLLGLVAQVLDLSRIEAGAAPLVLAPLDVAAVIEAIAGPMRLMAQERGLSFVVDVAPELPSVMSDGAKVRQVLLNLVGNAVKFTEHGEIRVSAQQDRPGSVRFSVSDTGRGIPAVEIPRVTEEFRQVPCDDGMKPEGTGLGLAIAAKLVDCLGSGLEITSVVGKGSTFSFSVPVEPTAEMLAVAASRTE